MSTMDKIIPLSICSSAFRIKKTNFVIELSDGRRLKSTENATSKYTFIQISKWDVILFVDILKSMKDQQYQTIISKILSQAGNDPLSLQTLTGIPNSKIHFHNNLLTKTFFFL